MSQTRTEIQHPLEGVEIVRLVSQPRGTPNAAHETSYSQCSNLHFAESHKAVRQTRK